MIRINNLTKIYKSKRRSRCKALDNINLTLPNKGLVFVLGKSESGKSSLLKSILLSAIFPYKDALTEAEKLMYKRLRQFHGIENTYFCVFIECKDLLWKAEDNNSIDWIYETLSNSIRIDRHVDKEDFYALLEKYNHHYPQTQYIDLMLPVFLRF